MYLLLEALPPGPLALSNISTVYFLDNKFAITVWGVRDNESWLIDFWGNPEWPLLFDANYNKKPAYYGYLEGLQ